MSKVKSVSGTCGLEENKNGDRKYFQRKVSLTDCLQSCRDGRKSVEKQFNPQKANILSIEGKFEKLQTDNFKFRK